MSDLGTQLRAYIEEIDPLFDAQDLMRDSETTNSAAPRWRPHPVVVVGSVALAVMLIIGAAGLLFTGDSSPPTASPLAGIPLEEVQGVTRSGDVQWAWHADGRLAGRWLSNWNAFPSLPDPVVDVALHDGTAWAITTNRCDPTVPDWEFVGCETTLWRLVDEAWEQIPELGDLQLPDDLADIEFDSTGTLWVVTAEGALYNWDGITAVAVVEAGLLHPDAVAIAGDGTVWASRFNPYFPDDVGFARFDGGWQAFNPLGSENNHAVMTTTEDGDLWVWFSEYPATGSLSGRALAYYDSKTGQWTIHESNIPDASVRAMTAINESVWLATFFEDAALWRFNGEHWTRVHDASGSELLDVVAARDGTVWYVEDNTLYELQP
jgi:hypothetical protein